MPDRTTARTATGRLAAMLSAAGLDSDDLGCPPALPSHEATQGRVAGRGPHARPAGDELLGQARGDAGGMAAAWPTAGYLERDHPLQQAIEARLAEAAANR